MDNSAVFIIGLLTKPLLTYDKRTVVDLFQLAVVVAMVALATLQLVGDDPLAHPLPLWCKLSARGAAAFVLAKLGSDFSHGLAVPSAPRADPTPGNSVLLFPRHPPWKIKGGQCVTSLYLRMHFVLGLLQALAMLSEPLPPDVSQELLEEGSALGVHTTSSLPKPSSPIRDPVLGLGVLPLQVTDPLTRKPSQLCSGKSEWAPRTFPPSLKWGSLRPNRRQGPKPGQAVLLPRRAVELGEVVHFLRGGLEDSGLHLRLIHRRGIGDEFIGADRATPRRVAILQEEAGALPAMVNARYLERSAWDARVIIIITHVVHWWLQWWVMLS